MDKLEGDAPLLDTIRRFADRVGMTPWWVHQRIRYDDLPYVKIGRGTFIPYHEGKAWVERHKVRRGRDDSTAKSHSA